MTTQITVTIGVDVDVSPEALTLWVRDMLNYNVPLTDDERRRLDAHAAEIDKLDEHAGPVTVAEPRRRKPRADKGATA
jgi:hypothetical protein